MAETDTKPRTHKSSEGANYIAPFATPKPMPDPPEPPSAEVVAKCREIERRNRAAAFERDNPYKSTIHPARPSAPPPVIRTERVESVAWFWSYANGMAKGYTLYRAAFGPITLLTVDERVTAALPRSITSKADTVKVDWLVGWHLNARGEAELDSIQDMSKERSEMGQPAVTDTTSELNEAFPRDANNQPVDQVDDPAPADNPQVEQASGDQRWSGSWWASARNVLKAEAGIDDADQDAFIHASFSVQSMKDVPGDVSANSALAYVKRHAKMFKDGQFKPDLDKYRKAKRASKTDTPKAASETALESTEAKSQSTPQTKSNEGQSGEIPRSEPANVPANDKADPSTGEIVVYDATRAIERMMQRSDIMTGIRKSGILKAGIDYGVIPGTESKDPDKPSKQTLLKPGAEKLCSAFGLCPEFHLVDKTVSWSPDAPMFYFQYECRLVDIATGKTVATGIGSCNSMESKYRWRNANRTCPKCGKELRKSKDKPEFYCWHKTGGCSATFNEKDPAITGQKLGKVPNDDVFSLVNTIDKMAQKRALIAATLIGTNASDHFTQDVEDIPQFGYIDAEIIEAA